MKSLFTKTLILIAISLFALSIQAQTPDYVITNKGDTIKCVVNDIVAFSFYDKYQTSDMRISKKITEANFQEFYIAEKKQLFRRVAYQSAFKPDERDTSFLQVIERGKINLYEDIHISSNGMRVSPFYISKSVDTATHINFNDIIPKEMLIADFAEILKDNKEVYDKFIADNKLTFKAIRNIVHLYNTGEPYKEPQKTKKVPSNFNSTDNVSDFNPNQN